MITTIYTFSSSSGFTFDASKITFSGGHAALLIQTNPLTFVPDLSTSTFGSTLQYGSGSLHQIDQAPANSTFYASFASSINGDWGGGTLTGTAFNGAAIVGGYLDLTGYSEKYTEYSAVANSDSVQVGAVKFKVTPNYSGIPSDYQILWSTFTTSGQGENLIEIYHSITTGHMHLLINNSAGSTILAPDLGVWNPVSGTEYEFELNWDLTTGATRLFIDGIQLGSTATQTGTRALPLLMRIGAEHIVTPSDSANFKMRQLIIFNAVQHTANYTPGYSYSSTLYVLATANLPLFTYGGIGFISAFTSFVTTDSNGVQYTLGGKYWNGSAWVTSNGSYAQSNSAATINTNIAAYTPVSSLQIDAIFPASNNQASVSAVTFGYSSQNYPISDPTIYPNMPITMDALASFTAVIAASGSDAVQFYLLIGSTKYWHNGTAWVPSNGTLAQSNTANQINSHASTLPISLGAFVTPIALLHSATGMTTPSLTSETLVYNFFGTAPNPPNTCLVFGYIVDETEAPVANAVVTVVNPTTFFLSGYVFAQGQNTFVTEADGYFEFNLVETTTATPPQSFSFSVRYPTKITHKFGKAVIPDTPEINFTALTFT